MSKTSVSGVMGLINSYLTEQQLVLCRSTDTRFAFRGVEKLKVLHEMSQSIHDSWDDDITAEVPEITLTHLRLLSVAA